MISIPPYYAIEEMKRSHNRDVNLVYYARSRAPAPTQGNFIHIACIEYFSKPLL